jgi:hypothetical protein
MRREWLKHALRRAPWRTQMQAATLVALGLVVSIIIGAMYLAQATATATAGRDLEILKQELEDLKHQNDLLRSQIAAGQTVPQLTRRALDLGFIPAGNDQIMYLVVEGYQPPAPEPVVQVVEEALPEYNETLNDWLSHQWDRFLTELNLRDSDEETEAD